ncbi:hypothetical protein ACJMK2_003602 [Sinanodonta woodiana]|uniref:Uncharacterized protein n=1 Tax=Sinanodonta woodiana TaxID=1069815 RepID=A0ABD3Y1Z3_SINWO
MQHRTCPKKDKIQKHPLYSGFLLCSPDFLEECLKCPTLGKHVSIYGMIASSNLLNLKADLVYPAVNRSKDYTFVKLNSVLIPMVCDQEKTTITIIWTNTHTSNMNGFINKRKALTDTESISETILESPTWLEDPAMEDIQIPPSQSTSEMEDSHRDMRSRQM